MKRAIRQRERGRDGAAHAGRKWTEHSINGNAAQRGLPCECATKAASFVAIGTNSLPEETWTCHSLVKPNTKNGELQVPQQRWGNGVGWVRDFYFLFQHNKACAVDGGILTNYLLLHCNDLSFHILRCHKQLLERTRWLCSGSSRSGGD